MGVRIFHLAVKLATNILDMRMKIGVMLHPITMVIRWADCCCIVICISIRLNCSLSFRAAWHRGGWTRLPSNAMNSTFTSCSLISQLQNSIQTRLFSERADRNLVMDRRGSWEYERRQTTGSHLMAENSCFPVQRRRVMYSIRVM